MRIRCGRALANFALAVVATAFVLACGSGDQAVSPNTRALGSTAPQTDRSPLAHPRIYTPEELRALNPYRWAGQLHNYIVKVLVEETRKGGVTRLEACQRVLSRLTQDDLGAGAPEVTDGFRDEIRRGMEATPACRDPGTRKVSWLSVPSAQEETWTYPSSAAQDLAADMDADTESATDATELASILSPYYTASLSMGFPDADYIQANIGIAQDSWSGWDPEGSYGATEDAEVAYLNQCEQGLLENEQYSTGEYTYQCTENEWRLVTSTLKRSPVPFRLVAYTPVAQGYWCSVDDVAGVPDPGASRTHVLTD